MLKKIFAIVVLSVLLLSVFSVVSFAENEVLLSIHDEEVYAGDSFTADLFISDNSNMSGAVIDIFYDKTKLEFVSATSGAILNENANISIKNIDGKNPSVRFTYLDPSSSVISSGIIAKIEFKVLDGAIGATELKISVPNAGDFVTKDLDRIIYSVKNGNIKIINTSNEEVNSVSNETASDLKETASQSGTQMISAEPATSNPIDNNEKNQRNNAVPYIIASVGAVLVISAVLYVVITKKGKKKK